MSFVTTQELRNKINFCLGITLWKRDIFATYLGGRSNCYFIPLNNIDQAIEQAEEVGGRIICWSSSEPEGLVDEARKKNVEVIFVEDGFIRSSGLGIKLNLPGSLCFSRYGIHYDCNQPSELETALNEKTFTKEEKQQGRDLLKVMRDCRISKYNINTPRKGAWPDGRSQHKKKVLVIGQVGDDASIRLGTHDIKTNEGLIRRVYDLHADQDQTSIIYRPHPDVVTGLREGRVPQHVINTFCNGISYKENIFDLIEMADEVHVISSQTGLEALILGKKVFCHGMPFYAGWGLTHDSHDCPRRQRSLSLEELLYTIFVSYPVYVDPFTGQGSDVFEMIDLIQTSSSWPRAPRLYIAGVWLKRRKRALRKWFGPT